MRCLRLAMRAADLMISIREEISRLNDVVGRELRHPLNTFEGYALIHISSILPLWTEYPFQHTNAGAENSTSADHSSRLDPIFEERWAIRWDWPYKINGWGGTQKNSKVKMESGFGDENHYFRTEKRQVGSFSFWNVICIPAWHVASENHLFHVPFEKLNFALKITWYVMWAVISGASGLMEENEREMD